MSSLYPSLDEYMGLNLQSVEVRQNLAVIPAPQFQPPAVVSNRPTQITGIYAAEAAYSLTLFNFWSCFFFVFGFEPQFMDLDLILFIS